MLRSFLSAIFLYPQNRFDFAYLGPFLGAKNLSFGIFEPLMHPGTILRLLKHLAINFSRTSAPRTTKWLGAMLRTDGVMLFRMLHSRRECACHFSGGVVSGIRIALIWLSSDHLQTGPQSCQHGAGNFEARFEGDRTKTEVLRCESRSEFPSDAAPNPPSRVQYSNRHHAICSHQHDT